MMSGTRRPRAMASSSSSSALTRENFRRTLDPLLGRGDFLLNVSVDVSSIALIRYCWEKGAMYLDTCIEPWPGGYTDPTIPAAKRTNYALREEALALRSRQRARADRGAHARRQSRAGVAPGQAGAAEYRRRHSASTRAEPGQPRRMGRAGAAPRRQGDPHRRARHAGVDASRRSRTSSSTPGRSTASCRKAAQPAELGWGSHERNFPRDGTPL